MTTVLLILAAGAAAMTLTRWLHLPAVPMLVLSGIALAALGLVQDVQLFQEALVMGLAFLVFSAGAEMSPRRVGAQQNAAIQVGLAQFVTMTGIGWLLGRWFGFGALTGLYVALALAASSTLVVIRLLKQRQQLFEPFGRLVVGILLVQDALIILALAALSGIEGGPTAVLISVNGTLGLMLIAWVAQSRVTPWLMLRFGLDDEEKLLVALAILFFFMGAAFLIDVPIVVGAFLAGVAISSFPVNGILHGQLTTLNEFFLVLFFVTLGAMLRMPTRNELLLAVLLALVVLIVTPVVVMLIARHAGMSHRTALESGFLVAQMSEFSLVLGLIGVQQGHLSPALLGVLTLATVLTMIATPRISADHVTIYILHWLANRNPLPIPALPPNPILLLGCGERGNPVLEWLLARDQPVVVVDDEIAVIERVRAAGALAIYGDAANPAILKAAGAENARLIIATLKRLAHSPAFLAYADKTPVLISLFEPESADRIAALGGTPILESFAAADDFSAWFAEQFPR